MAIGVFGAGPGNRKATETLLDEAYSQEQQTFLIPAGVPSFTDTVRFTADWAQKHNHEIVFLADSHDLVDLEDYGDRIVLFAGDLDTYLARAADTLLVAFPTEPGPITSAQVEKVATEALRRGKPVLDLTDGLYPVTDPDLVPDLLDEDVAAAPEAVQEAPAPPPAPEPVQEAVEEPDEAQAALPTEPLEDPADVLRPLVNALVEEALERFFRDTAVTLTFTIPAGGSAPGPVPER